MLVEPGTNKMVFVNKAAKELKFKADGVMHWSLEVETDEVTHPLE